MEARENLGKSMLIGETIKKRIEQVEHKISDADKCIKLFNDSNFISRIYH